MPEPIVAYHSVFEAYGFWLPNDPRGSWSVQVKAKHLKSFGEPIRSTTRRSVAKHSHDIGLRLAAKNRLLRRNVFFDDEQIDCLGRAFEELIAQVQIVLFALAIMPDHVHLVYPRQDSNSEKVVGLFKRSGSRRLRKEDRHPFTKETEAAERLPMPWAKNAWHVFLHNDEEIRQRIAYVNGNPTRAGRPKQRWSFVTEL